MPRINFEYSSNIPDQNIDFQELLKALHEDIAADGFCNIAAVKSRVIAHDNYYVADGNPDNAFIMVSVGVLNGRTLSALQKKGESMLAIIKEKFPKTNDLGKGTITIEFREMSKDLYFL